MSMTLMPDCPTFMLITNHWSKGLPHRDALVKTVRCNAAKYNTIILLSKDTPLSRGRSGLPHTHRAHPRRRGQQRHPTRSPSPTHGSSPREPPLRNRHRACSRRGVWDHVFSHVTSHTDEAGEGGLGSQHRGDDQSRSPAPSVSSRTWGHDRTPGSPTGRPRTTLEMVPADHRYTSV